MLLCGYQKVRIVCSYLYFKFCGVTICFLFCLENKVHAAKPKRTIKTVSFEEALKTVMIIGHAFGLMPVDGLINSKRTVVR